MRRSFHAYAVSGCVAAACLVASPAVRADDRHDSVDAFFAPWDGDASPGCAVGVFQDGATAYAAGYGVANLEHGAPITPDTVFYVASISKQFVAMATLLASREGLLSLDDDVRTYVPELPDYGATITIRNLITHTSGLKDYLVLWPLSGRSQSDHMPADQVLDLLSRQRSPLFEPGAQWSYSNTGYFLLSVVVERATGASLRDYAEARIFEPLGMSDTHFHDDHDMIVRNRAIGHAKTAAGDYEMVVTAFDLVGSGGLLTTINDFAKWNANFDANVLDDGAEDLMPAFLDLGVSTGETGGETTSYGFGLGFGEYRELALVHHSGGSFGYRADFMRLPEKGFAAAVFCNGPETNPLALSRQVIDAYLFDGVAAEAVDDGQPSDEAGLPAVYSPSAEALEAIAGDYYSEELDAVLRLRVTDGALVARRGWAPPETLFATGDDAFAFFQGGRGYRLKFTSGAAGARDVVTIEAPRVGALAFERR